MPFANSPFTIIKNLAEKFRDLPEEVAVVKSFSQAMEPIHRQYARQWYLNVSNYMGNQYLQFDYKQKNFVVPNAPSWRVRFTANKLQPLARTQMAKIKDIKMNFNAVARTSDEGDQKGAKLTSKIAENIYYASDFDQTKDDLVLWQGICGNGYIGTFYDADAGRELRDVKKGEDGLPVMDKDGQPMMVTFGTGDIVFDAISPFEIVPDFSVTKWSEMMGVMRKKIRSVDYIEEKYGVKVSSEEIPQELLEGLKISNMVTANSSLSGMRSDIKGQTLKNVAIVRELFLRPTKKHPKGRHLIVADDKLLHSGDLSDYKLYGKYEIPIFHVPAIPVPGRLLAISSFENGMPVQWMYNRLRSIMIEHANLVSGPRLIAPLDSVPDGSYTDRPLSMIEYDPAAGERPTFETPGNLPSYIMDGIKLLMSELEDIFGIHDISQGRLPRRATSGVALSILEEKDTTVVIPMKQFYRRGMEKAFSVAMGIASNKFDDTRISKIVGENNKVYLQEWRKTDMGSVDDVRLVEDSQMPTSKAAKMEAGINLAKAGIIGPNKALTMMGMDSIIDIQDETTTAIDQRNADGENFQMMKRIEVFPSELEPFQIHIANHTAKLEANPNWPDDVKATFKRHIDMTGQLSSLKGKALTGQQQPVSIEQGALEAPPTGPDGQPALGVGEGVEI